MEKRIKLSEVQFGVVAQTQKEINEVNAVLEQAKQKQAIAVELLLDFYGLRDKKPQLNFETRELVYEETE